jgi:PleD family two-component response regulator
MAKFHRAHASSTVLVVHSDALMLTAIGGVLDMQGYRVLLARTEPVAAQALATTPVDLIILAIDALETGCQFAARLRNTEATREVPVIFVVPELSTEAMGELSQHGGVYCVLANVDPNELIDLVDKALWMPHLTKLRSAPPAAHLSVSQDWIKLD